MLLWSWWTTSSKICIKVMAYKSHCHNCFWWLYKSDIASETTCIHNEPLIIAYIARLGSSGFTNFVLAACWNNLISVIFLYVNTALSLLFTVYWTKSNYRTQVGGILWQSYHNGQQYIYVFFGSFSQLIVSLHEKPFSCNTDLIIRY